MCDMKEDMKAFRECRRDKRERNREYSTALLTKEGIKFESRNDGLHLMIETSKGRINFYPSTGLYNGVLQGRGVKSLIAKIIDIQVDDCLALCDEQWDGDDIIGFRD